MERDMAANNKIPEVIFRRSWLYDQALARKRSFKMPSDDVLKSQVKKLEEVWEKDGGKILKEIAKVTKSPWHEKEIVCYVTSGVIPYSDPLTLNLSSGVDTLTHELIHRILSEPENKKRLQGNWRKLMAKYEKEPPKTKTHIVVHAIHAAILLGLYGEKRLKKTKAAIQEPRYIRSWEIVDRDGYGYILKELTKSLR